MVKKNPLIVAQMPMGANDQGQISRNQSQTIYKNVYDSSRAGLDHAILRNKRKYNSTKPCEMEYVILKQISSRFRLVSVASPK